MVVNLMRKYPNYVHNELQAITVVLMAHLFLMAFYHVYGTTMKCEL